MMPEDNQNPIHDISQPGRVGPTPTSRPVIVGHRPTMPDPMVTNRPITHNQAPAAPIESTPPTPPPQPTQPQRPVPHVPPMPIDGISAPPRPLSTSPQPPANPSVMAGEPLQSPAFNREASEPDITQVEPIPQSVPAVTPEAPKQRQATNLHHHHHERQTPSLPLPANLVKHRTKWWAPVVVLLVIFIGLYLMVDAGVINTNINLPFHIFKQESPPVYTPS